MTARDVALLLRPEEAVELLGISRSKIYAMLAEGILPQIRCGKSVRIPRDALQAWVKANTVGGDSK